MHGEHQVQRNKTREIYFIV